MRGIVSSSPIPPTCLDGRARSRALGVNTPDSRYWPHLGEGQQLHASSTGGGGEQRCIGERGRRGTKVHRGEGEEGTKVHRERGRRGT